MRAAWAQKIKDFLKPDGELITLMFPVRSLYLHFLFRFLSLFGDFPLQVNNNTLMSFYLFIFLFVHVSSLGHLCLNYFPMLLLKLKLRCCRLVIMSVDLLIKYQYLSNTLPSDFFS